MRADYQRTGQQERTPHGGRRTDAQTQTPTPRVSRPTFSWRMLGAGENTPCRKIYAKMFSEKQIALIFFLTVLNSVYEKQTLQMRGHESR